MQDQPVIPNNEGHVPKQRVGQVRPIFAFLVPFFIFAFMTWIDKSDEYEKWYGQEMSEKGVIAIPEWKPTPEQNGNIAYYCLVVGSICGLMGLGVERACTVAVKAIIRLKK